MNKTEIPCSGAIQRNFKDTLFRKIFNDEGKLLSLYNAVNNTAYDDPKDLKEYAIYVEKVREHVKNMEISNAVEMAVAESIKEGILVEFLTKYRAEAIQMSIFEYDAEKEYEKILYTMRQTALAEHAKGRNAGYADGRDDGYADGHDDGYADGRNNGRSEERIAMIRKKHQTGKSTIEIISALELEEAFVKAVIEILNQSPELSDADITELIISSNVSK